MIEASLRPDDRIRAGVYRRLPTHQEVYTKHAAKYEALVSREDYQGNLLRAIEDIVALSNTEVLDLGSGTGRLAGLLGPRVRSLLAFDASPHMLAIARDKLRRLSPAPRWLAAVADHRLLPLASHTADLIVSGWSVSYVAIWNPGTWRREADAWLEEANRVLREKGHIILFESLGTGNETPQPLPHLVDFYGWLEQVGFATTWIRTDYRFESEELADELASFFFGDDMKSKIRRDAEITLPECTGVWWKQS